LQPHSFRLHRWRLLLAATLSLGLAACPDDDDPVDRDVGADLGSDLDLGDDIDPDTLPDMEGDMEGDASPDMDPDTGGDMATDTGGDATDEPDMGAGSTITGRVEETRDKAVSGAIVSAYRVETDGTLTVISNEDTTDADGRYEIFVLLDGNIEGDVLVRAEESGGAEGSVLLSATLEEGTTVTAAPIDVETAVEADVYVEARASGELDADRHSRAGLRTFVSAEVAAAIQAVADSATSADYEAEVEVAAEAALAFAEGWHAALTDEFSGATSAEVEAAWEAVATAQIVYDLALDAAADGSARDAAREAFVTAMFDAWATAGISGRDLVFAAQVAVEASYAYTSELDGDVAGAVRAELALTEAMVMTRAFEAWFADLEAEGAVDADVVADVEAAGDDLEADIGAAFDAGAEIGDDVRDAWDAYSATIAAELDAAVSASGSAAVTAYANVEATMETAADALSAAIAALTASAAIDATAEASVDAHATYYEATTASAVVDVLTTAGVGSATAEAIVQLRAALGARGFGSATAAIEGRVEELREKSVAGAIVSAYHVESDGDLRLISNGTTTTDADGRYRLQVFLSGEGVERILVQATASGAGSDAGSVLVEAALEAGATVTAAPIEVETSVEADVYVEARASGDFDAERHSRAVLRTFVSAELAARVQAIAEDTGSADYEAEVAAVAEAALAFSEAWYVSLTDETSGASEATVEAAFEALAEAQVDLDEALDAAEGSSEVDAALQAYLEASLDAYLDAGVTHTQLVVAVQAAAEASFAYATELTADVEAALRARVAWTEAMVVSTATDAWFAALEAEGAVTASVVSDVEDAGATLRTSVEAAVDAGASAESDIADAFATYESAVSAELDAMISGMGAGTVTAYATVEAAIDAAAGTMATAIAALSASASVAVSGEAAAELVATFYAAATSSTLVDGLTTTGVASAVAELTVRIRAVVAASATS
jgi:hypothetical protein